ncbi:hypothetical protein VTI74DRAFT_4731 [Chaetomium olivicolor]
MTVATMPSYPRYVRQKGLASRPFALSRESKSSLTHAGAPVAEEEAEAVVDVDSLLEEVSEVEVEAEVEVAVGSGSRVTTMVDVRVKAVASGAPQEAQKAKLNAFVNLKRVDRVGILALKDPSGSGNGWCGRTTVYQSLEPVLLKPSLAAAAELLLVDPSGPRASSDA